MSRDECKTASVDDETKYRTKENYQQTIQSIQNSGLSTVDLKETKGIKKYCKLNDLVNFHILDNFTVDIMHDLLEGTVPFLLTQVFLYCIDERVFSECELQNCFFFFDYGKLNCHNIPSLLNLNKKSLGQNASQMKCLFQNLPLILHDYRNNAKLTKIWPCIDSMLKILQIVYSSSISLNDLVNLKMFISDHLKSIIKYFDVDLIPKHHMMVHYPKVIEMIGPLVHLSTLRYESKHRQFTRYAQQSNNFINLSKSLCNRYQRSNVFNEPYMNAITHANSKRFKNDLSLDVSRYFNDIESISEVSWLKINSNFYKKGLLLKSNNSFHEIRNILLQNKEYYFVCIGYNSIGFDKFLHCVQLEKCAFNQYRLLKHSDLLYKKSHDKRILQEKIYLIADSLELVG